MKLSQTKPSEKETIRYDDLTVENLDDVLYDDVLTENFFSKKREKGFKYNIHSLELFEALVDSYHPHVIHYLCQNPHTPASILQRIIDSEVDEYRVRTLQWFDYPFFIGHPNLTPGQIITLIQKPTTRAGVAENLGETIPDEIFELLNSFDEYELACKLAGNPYTPVSILETYDKHTVGPATSIVRALAGNPKTPTSILREIVTKNDETVDDELILNPSTPFDVLPLIWNKNVQRRAAGFIDFIATLADEAHPVIGWKAQIFSERLLVSSNVTQLDTYLVTKENYLTLLHDEYPGLTMDTPIEWLKELTNTLPDEAFTVTLEELLKHKWVGKDFKSE